eukprot:tig00021434_g21333.t1
MVAQDYLDAGRSTRAQPAEDRRSRIREENEKWRAAIVKPRGGRQLGEPGHHLGTTLVPIKEAPPPARVSTPDVIAQTRQTLFGRARPPPPPPPAPPPRDIFGGPGPAPRPAAEPAPPQGSGEPPNVHEGLPPFGSPPRLQRSTSALPPPRGALPAPASPSKPATALPTARTTFAPTPTILNPREPPTSEIRVRQFIPPPAAARPIAVRQYAPEPHAATLNPEESVPRRRIEVPMEPTVPPGDGADDDGDSDGGVEEAMAEGAPTGATGPFRNSRRTLRLRFGCAGRFPAARARGTRTSRGHSAPRKARRTPPGAAPIPRGGLRRAAFPPQPAGRFPPWTPARPTPFSAPRAAPGARTPASDWAAAPSPSPAPGHESESRPGSRQHRRRQQQQQPQEAPSLEPAASASSILSSGSFRRSLARVTYPGGRSSPSSAASSASAHTPLPGEPPGPGGLLSTATELGRLGALSRGAFLPGADTASTAPAAMYPSAPSPAVTPVPRPGSQQHPYPSSLPSSAAPGRPIAAFGSPSKPPRPSIHDLLRSTSSSVPPMGSLLPSLA